MKLDIKVKRVSLEVLHLLCGQPDIKVFSRKYSYVAMIIVR